MSNYSSSFRKTYLPYVLQRLADGRYIPLNRHYKPLGELPPAHVRYEDHVSARAMKLTKPQLRKVAFDGVIRDDGSVFLYDDGCVPEHAEHWLAYAARLQVLAKARVG